MKVWLEQIFLFVIVGIIQVAIDSSILVGLSAAGASIAVANVSGRLSGAFAGFFLNGAATFSDQTKKRLAGKHLVRFIITWITLTLISTWLLYLLHMQVSLKTIWLAKPGIEIFLAFISFFVSKFWIYK